MSVGDGVLTQVGCVELPSRLHTLKIITFASAGSIMEVFISFGIFFFFLLSVWIYLNMVTFSIIILLLNHLKSLPDTWMLFFRNGWSYNIHVQFMSCLTLTQKRDFPACMLMHLVKLRIKIKGQCILFFVMLISRCLAQWGREHRMSYMKANDSCGGLEVMNKLVEMS